VLSRFRHVVGELHAEKVIHVRAESLLDAQGHFWSQCGLAVEKIGERSAAHLQNLRRLRHGEAESFNDFGSDQVSRMRRVLHRHFGHCNSMYGDTVRTSRDFPESAKYGVARLEAISQDLRHVPPALEDGRYLQRLRVRSVDDQVGVDREELHRHIS